MPEDYVATLEIGTSKVVVLVVEMREDGTPAVIGVGERPSVGVRKGEIIDLENASVCVRAALESAEESADQDIREIHLAVSGGHIQSEVSRGQAAVMGKDGEITEDDVEDAMEMARAVSLPSDREVLHTICQSFTVDDQEHVINPEGMEGSRLAVDMLVLHGRRTRIHNAIRVVSGIPMPVADVVFSGLCSSMAVVTAEQKETGVLIIDLGAGTTEYTVHADNITRAIGVLGVGGDHVTNDISRAFNISTAQAEDLKRQSGSVTLDRPDAGRRVEVPAQVGFQQTPIPLRSLYTVANARVDEILQMVRRRVDEAGLLHHLGAGVVLTGGGAELDGCRELAERLFGLPCSVGLARDVAGPTTITQKPAYTTSIGLALYAFQEEAPAGVRPSFGTLLRTLFRR